MPTRPTTTPPAWATNANYSGGPAVGTPTKVAPSGGLDAEGYEPAQKPGAQNVNYLWGLYSGWDQYFAAQMQVGLRDLFNNSAGNVKLTGTFLPDLGGNNGTTMPTHLAYVPNAGHAYVYPGSANNKIKIAPGLIMQMTGGDPDLLVYQTQGTDEVTIGDGNAVNPRIDLLQMQLTYSNGVTSATFSVKAGTAAATPQFPDPDAGYVAVAAVFVGKNYSNAVALSFGIGITTNSDAAVMDQRMPINVQAQQTDPQMMRMHTAWAFGTAFGAYGEYAQSSNATNELRIPAIKGSRTGRLIGISGIFHNITDSASNLINGWHFENNAFTALQWTVPTGFGAANDELVAIPYYTIEANFQGYGFFGAYTVSATNKIGVPLWSNGQMAPYTVAANVTRYAPGGVEFVVVSGQNTSRVAGFNFHWAQGI